MSSVLKRIAVITLVLLCLCLCACDKEVKPKPTPVPTPSPSPEIPGLRDYNKGLSYYNADGVERDFEKALEFFLEAANNEHVPAMEKLGYMHEMGLGTPRNSETAGLWFSVAAQKGSAIAKEYIDGVGHLDEKAVHSLLPADAVSEYEQGMACFYGIREVQDYDLAYEHFSASAELACGRGHYGLGVCYLHGKGTERDIEKAAQHFEKALELGCLDAADKLILIYSGQYGDEVNEELEAKWRQRRLEILTIAAGMGYNEYLLEASETALDDGLEDEALSLYESYFDSYREASQAGDSQAQLAMAVLHMTRSKIIPQTEAEEADASDENVEFEADPNAPDPDMEEAVELLELAAEQGDTYAAHFLWCLQLEDEDFLEQQTAAFTDNPEYVYAINSHYWLSYEDAQGSTKLRIVYIPACAPGETTQIKDRFTGEVLYEIKLERKTLVKDLADCVSGKTPIMQNTKLLGLYALDSCLEMYEECGISQLFALAQQYGDYSDFMHSDHPLKGSLISLGELARMYLELLPPQFR